MDVWYQENPYHEISMIRVSKFSSAKLRNLEQTPFPIYVKYLSKYLFILTILKQIFYV